ncbi:MAG: hypothetical protein FWC20_08050 [Oscillospiraceae bacterium]|nr:hypothetical protein [Oscillospiraceae bacterium]MCL2279337.1 hypothetical protein [Oscillospiraceae bacterium]
MLNLITLATQKIEERAAAVGIIYQLVASYYKRVISREIDLAEISGDDNVLFIGGGICPLSAILIHQSTGAMVTVVDNDLDCVGKAALVVERLGLCDKIKVLYADGGDRDFLLDGYTVIHLALQVTPVEKVFAELKRRVSPGVKLLVRRPKDKLCALYCDLSAKTLNSCNCVIHPGASNIGSTFMYTKGAVESGNSAEIKAA